MAKFMAKYWQAIVAVVLLSGAGCCHDCGCWDWCSWRHDNRSQLRLDEGPPPLPVTPPANTAAPVVPRTPTGAYGGTGQ